MPFRMKRSLRLRVDVECSRRNISTGNWRNIAAILYELENADQAMRYIDQRGRLAWKLTPEAVVEERAEMRDCDAEQ